jgi:hypothetical protein
VTVKELRARGQRDLRLAAPHRVEQRSRQGTRSSSRASPRCASS